VYRWLILALLAAAACSEDGTVQPVTSVQVCPVCPISPPPYDREEWHPRWYDLDGDCQDSRQEVLIAEGSDIVLDPKGCRVISGRWLDPYTNKLFIDPSQLDIDHFVALKNAHDSGGWLWTTEKKREFANDLINPGSLMAVSASANRSKGDRGPDEWLPTNLAYRCEFVRNWIKVKETWGLSLTAKEAKAIADLRCEVIQ
jgi:hypothetical protein